MKISKPKIKLTIHMIAIVKMCLEIAIRKISLKIKYFKGQVTKRIQPILKKTIKNYLKLKEIKI
jgi:hypothetical protein